MRVLYLESALVVEALALLGLALPVVSLELLEDVEQLVLDAFLGATKELVADAAVLALLVFVSALVAALGVLLLKLKVVLLAVAGFTGFLLFDLARARGDAIILVADVLLLALHSRAAVRLVVPVVLASLAPDGLGEHHLVKAG